MLSVQQKYMPLLQAQNHSARFKFIALELICFAVSTGFCGAMACSLARLNVIKSIMNILGMITHSLV